MLVCACTHKRKKIRDSSRDENSWSGALSKKLARAGKIYMVWNQYSSKYCNVKGTREPQTGCSM